MLQVETVVARQKMKVLAVLCVAVATLLHPANSFRSAAVLRRQATAPHAYASMPLLMVPGENEGVVSSVSEGSEQAEAVTSLAALLGLGAVMLLPVQEAVAGGSEYGIFAGRTASLLHPVTMLLLFGTSVYSGYLGLQWRRLRGLSTEISDLQKQAPRLSTGQATFPLSDSMQKVNDMMRTAGEADATLMQTLQRDLALLRGASELDLKIEELKTTRKQLQGADLKEKHHQTGSILLSAGVTVSLLGAFNTYMRAGKLFPGPHLYAGMACTALWACAAALVPAMQKGNEAARVAHIGFNVINVGLFAWQVVTGLDIMFKVWEKTSWP